VAAVQRLQTFAELLSIFDDVLFGVVESSTAIDIMNRVFWIIQSIGVVVEGIFPAVRCDI